MEVRNCPRCGKIFVYTGVNLCPACRREEEELFRQVRSFLHSHPGANLEEVAQGTGIDKGLILEFIRRGRLLPLKGEGELRCEICGRPIEQGRICRECAGELTQGLVKAKPASPPQREDSLRGEHRMHVADLVARKTGQEDRRGPGKKV